MQDNSITNDNLFVVGYRFVVIGKDNWCDVVVGGVSWMIDVGS